MNHKCIEKIKTYKIDRCSGESYNKCYDTSPMILKVWFMDTDGQEFNFDNWMEIQVNYCPFCGLKSQPERSKREDNQFFDVKKMVDAVL